MPPRQTKVDQDQIYEDVFDLDGNDDLIPTEGSENIFITTGNDEIMPSLTGTEDDNYELDGNGDIQPKA